MKFRNRNKQLSQLDLSQGIEMAGVLGLEQIEALDRVTRRQHAAKPEEHITVRLPLIGDLMGVPKDEESQNDKQTYPQLNAAPVHGLFMLDSAQQPIRVNILAAFGPPSEDPNIISKHGIDSYIKAEAPVSFTELPLKPEYHSLAGRIATSGLLTAMYYPSREKYTANSEMNFRLRLNIVDL